MPWRDVLAQLKHDASFEGWQAYRALATKYGADETIWLSMYAPAVIHRDLFNLCLMICLQEPEASAEKTLTELQQVVRTLRFTPGPSERVRIDKQLLELHQFSIGNLQRMLPAVAEFFPAVFRAYLHDTSPVQQSADEMMREARDEANARRRKIALQHLGQAGSQVLRGARIWDGWYDEGTAEFGYWALLLHTIDEGGRASKLLPLGTIAEERAQSALRQHQLADAITQDEAVRPTDAMLHAVPDQAELEQIITELQALEDHPETLSDGEIYAMDRDKYRLLGESALRLVGLSEVLRQSEESEEPLEGLEGYDQVEALAEVLVTAVTALGVLRYDTPQALSALFRLVTHGLDMFTDVTEMTIWALQQMGEPAVSMARQVVTYSSDELACDDCLRIIGGAGRGDPRVYEELAERFTQSTWADDRARYVIPIALTGDPRAADLLVPHLADPDLSEDDADDTLEALSTLKVHFTVDQETRDVTVDGYGTFEGIAPVEWEEDEDDLFEDEVEPVYDEQGVPRCPHCGGEMVMVEGHWEHLEEGGLILDANEDEVVYDANGVPRDPTTGEEMHFVGGRWQRLPQLKAPDTSYGLTNTTTSPLIFSNVGRNDPCPCGSGKKFKYCHGKTS
jgi:hypothetical protein